MAVRIETQAEPIPGYKLLERLGGGGFGEVWKAMAPGEILKAIKFVYGSLQTASEETQRAEQELKALSRVKSVRHPYILSLERFDIIDGQLMIVMELADRNLWDRFRECRAQGLPGIPRAELLGYMEETAEALDLMNIQYQLQHLDIKPQNLFLVHNHAKVADFGLVKDLEGMMASVTGGVTPVYAAPETFDGWVSRYCDQYSLAIVYQELLTGQRPFTGSTVRQLVVQHLQMPPNLASLPPGDREGIGRALAKDPEERFPTCQDLIRALRAASAAEPAAASPGGGGSNAASVLTDSPSSDETSASGWSSPGDPPSSSSGVFLLSPRGQGDGASRYLRVAEAVEPGPAPKPPQVEETHGSGVLFPALVVGVGGLGLAVLRRLRAHLQEAFGSLANLPTLRLLYLDTDPEAASAAVREGPGAALEPNEVVCARLHRPSHYLRRHEGRTRIDSWFNLKMLYRIPRNQVTTGCRALGRLAFMDNYRLIARQLRTELEACTRPEELEAAGQQTGLGVRTNRPRIYVVAGLAGGTGGGMFLDLAYVARNLARALGHQRPEVVGLFLLPPVDPRPEQRQPLGNVFAALTELHHFSTPGVPFTARYDEHEKPLTGSEAPYQRCMLLPLGEGSEEAQIREAAGLAAEFLHRDLTSGLGRAADEGRTSFPGAAEPGHDLVCQTFGLYRVSWPRAALVRRVACRLCAGAVERWMSRDASSGVRQAVEEAVAELWNAEAIGGEQLLARFEKACAEALGRPAEEVFAELTRALESVDEHSDASSYPVLLGTLEQLEVVVGRPDGTMGMTAGAVIEPLRAAGEALVSRWGEKLATFAVRLIERPEYRLAGAEEAVRQLVAALEQDLRRHEPLVKELGERVAEARTRIGELLVALQANTPGKRRAAAVTRLLELLRVYPRWRYQSLLLQQVVLTYVSLRGQLADQLREINFCRNRLHELLRSFENAAQQTAGKETLASTRNLFPSGCYQLDEAVEQVIAAITPEDSQAFEHQVQNLIKQQFTALVHVCLTSANLLKNLELAMQREAEGIVGARLAGTDVAALYLAEESHDEHALEDVAEMFEQAAPRLTSPRFVRQPEVCVLATPPGPAGERFREVARQALSDRELTTVPSSGDIVFYREIPELLLSDLEYVGPAAYEAYAHLATVDCFTPHCRADITAWRSPAAG